MVPKIFEPLRLDFTCFSICRHLFFFFKIQIFFLANQRPDYYFFIVFCLKKQTKKTKLEVPFLAKELAQNWLTS